MLSLRFWYKKTKKLLTLRLSIEHYTLKIEH
jgi:hypothetical protein